MNWVNSDSVNIPSCIISNLSFFVFFFLLTGKDPCDNYLNDMVNDATGPINFTLFLTMFGDKLNGTDPEDVIKNAFACFDEDGTGKLYLCFFHNK